MDARYNAYNIARGNVNALRSGTYTNDGNGGFTYSESPNLDQLSATDLARHRKCRHLWKGFLLERYFEDNHSRNNRGRTGPRDRLLL
jgi:hypothetical protein